MLELNKIYQGDCLEVMQDIDSNSFNEIVTDPPYGLSFMGNDWDKAVPSIDIWQECLRVLKQGAFAFVMCIPRQDCLARMIINLEEAGFNMAFSSIYWTYASGFPKAQNISKKIDQRAGIKREVIGKAKHPTSDDRTGNKSPYQSNSHLNANYDITIPITPQAKALDGAYGGFQPKPAVEVIIVAMKPLEEKTYVDQALENGHGITWLDDCLIPFQSEIDKPSECTYQDIRNKDVEVEGENRWTSSSGKKRKTLEGRTYTPNKKGRFPANVLCEDNVLDDGIERKSGLMKQHIDGGKYNVYGKQYPRDVETIGDAGSFSRFFSLDAWFAERIKLLPKEAQKTFPWLIVPKASKSEKNKGCGELVKGNYHPTCKPLKLMSWLITLASREGDIVLDPFCGSGTTLIAAKMQDRQYIGIEKEEEYCEIARKRLSAIPQRLDSYTVL